ncbi:MAG TPA: FMN-binding negative transcriptional regulator [Ignavibacteria bacterium]|nr:FMN-binding negative transcriptional regulator [Ignavibacteria bacterium]
MYIPAHFKETDYKKIVSFIKEFNFGLLVSTDENEKVIATHIPFIITEKENKLTIKTHIAKANPQWKSFTDSKEVLAIFSEPHAYISPTNYIKQESVPTWNYMAVHVYGTPKLLESYEERLALIEETINEFESDFMHKWNELSDKYRNGLLNGIVAFEIEVKSIDAKSKLSQNRLPEERENIINSLSSSNDSLKVKISELMKNNNT